MREPTVDASDSHDTTFSLVQGGPPYRLQQKVGLIPRKGLGIPRPMIFFILLTWAAIMVWAISNKRMFAGVIAEPLLPHFGVYVCCLVTIPLFIAAEAVAEAISRRRRGLLEYGALIGDHGWLVQKRWILGTPVEDKGLLDAPELGPVADTVSMYEAVKHIKPVPLGLQSVVAIVVPALLPMIPVFAIEVPLKDVLLKLLGALI